MEVDVVRDTGIKPIVIDEIISYAKKYQVKKVILFGSRARGDFKRTSDIDIAVEGGNFARFALDVDEETSTLLKFDIVDLERNIQKELRNSIETEGIVIYEEV
jgi:predicted nucleotidyltransferase